MLVWFFRKYNDGSTEAAITLLTMGDLVLQSEISPEQSDGKNKIEVPTKEETFKNPLFKRLYSYLNIK